MTKDTNITAAAAAITAASFDAFFLVETSRVEIDLPTGEPMLFNGQQVAVNLHGPSTDVFAKAKDAADKEASKRVFKAMGAKGKKGDDEDKDADAKFLTAITEGFENFPFPGGAAAVYRDRRLQYIASQVRAHINDMGNFFPKPANS